MKRNIILISIVLLFAAGLAQAQPPQRNRAREAAFHGPFIENFTKPTSEFFNFNYRRNAYDYRYYSGHKSLTENGTDIMMYRIDPEDPAGAGRGPEIITKDYTFYGTYQRCYRYRRRSAPRSC